MKFYLTSGDTWPRLILMRLVLLLCGLVLGVVAWGGPAPRGYYDGEVINVKVHDLSTSENLPDIQYYSLPFCRPTQILSSNTNHHQANSPYYFETGVLVDPGDTCTITFALDERNSFAARIEQGYWVHMSLDGLPVVSTHKGEAATSLGFPLGVMDDGQAYLHNHLDFVVFYHTSMDYIGRRIVSFQVEPSSRATDPQSSSDPRQAVFVTSENQAIHFTYTLLWYYSPTHWVDREDALPEAAPNPRMGMLACGTLLLLFVMSGLIIAAAVALLRLRAQQLGLQIEMALEPLPKFIPVVPTQHSLA